MFRLPRRSVLFTSAVMAALGCWNATAQDDSQAIKHVFVIALENHNWTQPTTVTGGIQPVYQNVNAPFIYSLVHGTAKAYINNQLVNICSQVSYATEYHNVLATQSGCNLHIHPSEPNYIWAEAGSNFGIANDADPYPANVQTAEHLSGLLQTHGKTWKSYQEDTDLTMVNGQLIDLPLPQNQWTVPLKSFSGSFPASSNLNEFNSTFQYNYAAKHNPMVFFTDTNGGNDLTASNPMASHYAPMQQFEIDLANNKVANYNWITPNQYNDMHSKLTAGFAGVTGDASMIRAGDNFVSRVVPEIMASKAYSEGGAIIIWMDESEADGETGDNADDFNHTINEIVISPLAHENENGLPYASPIPYSHSSDLRTMQEIFHVRSTGTSPYLGDADNASDLSDLFKPGVIPSRP